jgi:hypothetical protein
VSLVEASLVALGVGELCIAGFVTAIADRSPMLTKRLIADADGQSPATLVARLSETCSACRWAVPTLNALQQRVQTAATPARLVAEIWGDEERFCDETGLLWSRRPFTVTTDGRLERLPIVVIFDAAGRQVTRVEAEDFDQLEELTAGMVGGFGGPVLEPASTAQSALATALDSLTRVLCARGLLGGDVSWLVDRGAADTPSLRAADAAAIVVTPTTARQLVEGKVDPAMALVRGEASVYGDVRLAAAALAGLPTGRQLASSQPEERAPARPNAGSAPQELVRVRRSVAAAECARMYDPVARRHLAQSLWEYQRSLADPQAIAVLEVFAELIDPRWTGC